MDSVSRMTIPTSDISSSGAPSGASGRLFAGGTAGLVRLAALCLVLSLSAAVSQAEAEPRTAAYFGVRLIDMSLGTTTPEEEARRAALEARLEEGMAASGRYVFVDTEPVRERADRYDNLAHCNGCDAKFARELGADVAVSAEVQKTSNLILHISVYIRDAATGALVGGGSADIRSNTDESWRRGIDYILKNRILRE